MRVTQYEEIPRINIIESSKEVLLFLDVAYGRKNRICLTYDTKDEALKRTALLVNFRKRHENTPKIWATTIARRQNKVYLENNFKGGNYGRENE